MSSANSTELDGYLDAEERDHKKIQTSTFLRLLKAVLQHKNPLATGAFMIILGTLCTLLEPRIIGYAIDDGIIPKDWNRLRLFTGAFVFVTSLRVVAAVQQGYYFEVLGQRVTQDLRVRLFSHLQQMPVATFDRNPSGRLLTRVTNDIAALNEMFSAGFVSMICNTLLVVGILGWLISMTFKLGLIAASVFPCLLVIAVYFSKRLKITYRESRSKLSALNAFLAENLSGMKTVHLFNRQKLHTDRFDRLNEWYANAQIMSVRIFALFQPAITVSAGISISLVIWFGGSEAVRGSLKLGVLVTYFSYILTLFQPIREIADKWNIFLSGMASAERVFSILDWDLESKNALIEVEAKPIEDLRGHIAFENVWFSYDGKNWILKDFSLEIQAGERIGIVGHTGAGKTTLISLLMRFYEPQKGRILLDGQDLKSYERRSLRASIGIVQQEVFLFSGSFEENVTFWKNSEEKAEGRKVREILSALKFSLRSHEELQERGSNFSMGERQMIAFARVLIANPRVWILDEATANMDSETEMLLHDALNSASTHRTTLLIAHRLATVRSADRIIVLHKGVLVEMGSHDELMKKSGLYARLYRYQRSQEPAKESVREPAVDNSPQITLN